MPQAPSVKKAQGTAKGTWQKVYSPGIKTTNAKGRTRVVGKGYKTVYKPDMKAQRKLEAKRAKAASRKRVSK